MTLKAKIDYIEKYSPTFVVEDELYYQVFHLHFESLVKALNAVLELRARRKRKDKDVYQHAFVDGYTRALEDVRQAIEEEIK